jgi:hypothetical protein
LVKNTTTSRPGPAFRFTSTPSGSGATVSSKPAGASRKATRAPSLIPSFFANGVPE